MPDQTLLMMLDEVRGKTLSVLDGLSEREARWAPPGLQNTSLWHAGHVYVVVEWLTMEALGREPELPAGYYEMFSWDSRPGEVPANRWPALKEVVGQLKEQQKRLRKLLSGLTEEQLSGGTPDHPEDSPRYSIFHGLHDEACHSGEIYLLRKMLRAAERKA